MTLIVEDGQGLANSESYASVDEFKTYHTNYGNDIAALADTKIEQLLRRATQYMISNYRNKWAGYRKNNTQALDFPRYFVPLPDFNGLEYVSPDIVPIEVKYACCELALKANNGVLMTDETQKVIREKVDVIEVEYSEFSSSQTRYSQVDGLLSVFFKSANSLQTTVVRV